MGSRYRLQRGDGIYYTALPLLAATLTRDPLTISMVFFAEQLPWLLFALPAGVLVDRVDRRRLLWTVDAARFAVVGALGVAVLAGWATIWLLVVAGFLLGSARPCTTPPPRSSFPPSSPGTPPAWSGPTAASRAPRWSGDSLPAHQPAGCSSRPPQPSRS